MSMNKKLKTSKGTKKPHPTTKRKQKAKVQARYKENYHCTLSWREIPFPKEKIMELAQDFYRFSYNLVFNTKDPDPCTVHYWRAKVGLPRGTYDRWYAKYPEFKAIINEGKEMLGYIRERGMLKRELAERSTMFTMHNYSPDWLEFNKYHADLRNDDNKNSDIEVTINDLSDINEQKNKLT